MNNCEEHMSQSNPDEVLYLDNKEISQKDITEIVTYEDAHESSLLNSIVEAVMRGDMNQVVTLALSHRNMDPKDKGLVDEALSSALRNKLTCDQNKEIETDVDIESKTIMFDKEDDLTTMDISELSISKKDSTFDLTASNCIYSTMEKADENNDLQCSYYIDSNSIIESSNNITYCQSGFHNRNIDLDNHSEDHLNGNFSNYQTTSSIHNIETMNSLNSSQQSVQVQLPGIGNFLLQIPSNLKPGEPITLPINLPLTPVSQTSGGNPISINMNTGQLISNQLLSLYHPSSCMNNITIGKKMRAIAPKPSNPTYRQPLIAPKTNSPSSSVFNQECLSNVNSTPLPAPSGPGRRKGSKGKKVGRKRGAQPKSRKDSSYASSTHSIDSQDATQFTESNNTLKQNCNNFSSRNTYPINYFVNSDTSDYIHQSHIVPQSYNELHSNNLIDTSDSGEKDLLSLAWEISNAELGNNDDFSGTYQLYDTNNLSSEGFVSSELLDQFLQNIQKDDISELSRCSSNQISLDQRVSYASAFTTLPPCSTVLPSGITSNYLNNSSNNHTAAELSQCIEIAEVVNLNTEDMLSELEKEENALLDKFVAQYSSSASDSLKCDTHMYNDLNSSTPIKIVKYLDSDANIPSFETKMDDSEKDVDPIVKESNELSEIAKQIEKDCDELNIGNSAESKDYISHCDYDYQNQISDLNKSKENILSEGQDTYNLTNSGNLSINITPPLGLIYSTSTDSLNSTIVDCQNHYLSSVNVDKQRHSESTFYIGNGSLQSKTLDDFGLFDFCTDTGENQETDIACVDEKKYLEPPILEDISDATPIPSDEESEDEDIDICAFMLSAFNHLPLYSNKIYFTKATNMENLCYTFATNDLPTLLDTSPLQRQSGYSDKWYIYDTLINMADAFSTFKEIRKEENRSKINCLSVENARFDLNINPELSDNKESENQIEVVCLNDEKMRFDQIINMEHIKIKEPDINIEVTKCRRIRKNINNQNLCYHKDRLRKPPSELDIYHSIKPIDIELSIDSTKQQLSKKSEIGKDNRGIYNCFKLKHNVKVNHCTRSKGSISNSYDSFYETLAKAKRQQHSKIRKTKSHPCHQNKLNTIPKINLLTCETVEVINLSTYANTVDNNLNNNIDKDLESHITINDGKCNNTLPNDDKVSKTNRVQNLSKVSRKYNLRRNNGFVESNKKIGLSTLINTLDKEYGEENLTNEAFRNKLKTPNKKTKNKQKIEIKKSDCILNETIKIYNTDAIKINDNFNVPKNSNIKVELGMTPYESIYELCMATINITHSVTSDVCKIPPINVYDNNKSGNLSNKSFPVRKINRKLRLLSGLEQDKNINCATIIDFETFEYLIEYSLNIQVIEFRVFLSSLISSSECQCSIIHEFEVQSQYQHFETNDDDFDDGDSCDARLVIVENEEIANQMLIKNNDANTVTQFELNENKRVCESKTVDLPKRYSLRNKSREIVPVSIDIIEHRSVSPVPNSLRRPSLRRSCKKVDSDDIISERVSFDDLITVNKYCIKTPICSLEKLTNSDLLANLAKDILKSDILTSYQIEKSNNCGDLSNEDKLVACNNKTKFNKEKIISQRKSKIISKIPKRIKKTKSISNFYKNHLKLIQKRQINKRFNYSSRLKNKLRSKILSEESILKEHLELIEDGMSKITFEAENQSQNSVDNDNESIEVDDVIPKNNSCIYVDSNNVETFSRSYGSFSLKIKFQKQDPISVHSSKDHIKKRRKSSKKRKRLRHFLSSIMGSNRSTSSEESNNEESDHNIRHKTRKRKHTHMDSNIIDSSNQENINLNEDIPPKLTPESMENEDCEHQKPIKIKLFKSTSDEFSKSEDMIFSLKKSNVDNRKDNKKLFIPKMLQFFKDQPSKPCRQAANVAKKKIFSTAKEDRRSQNATLISIWNPRKLNNILNKLPTDFINSCNDRVRRPRGRPPKSIRTSLLSDKQTSSTGTLKLKIKLSKDFKNCNDDNLSSNGEISGRTSTNDSSILNSAVAGINGPSDALSLESNPFINGITQELDDNIEYLEAKEAKVYFDPNQVDIEKIKNSYYSSKKNSSIHFDNESQQNLYDDSTSDLCNKKKDTLCISRDFSQYVDNESSTTYNNNISKDFPKNCYHPLSTNREPQDLSQSNQSYSFQNQISSPGKNQSELISLCKNGNNHWFSEHRSFPNSNNILYDSYLSSNNKESKNCSSQSQNPPFILCENETSVSKNIQISPSKRSSSKEDRKSSNNSFESHSQLSPNYNRGALGSIPPQLNIHPWSDETNNNASLNHTAAAWMTYAQQQAAAAAYMDPQMKAYYNLALSQSMLNNPYCGSYSNPVGNPENFYSSLHSQYLNNAKDLNEKNNNSSGAIRNHNDPMGTFMEAAQMSSWEHFYSAAAMAGYHNSSQGSMDDYNGHVGAILQAHNILADRYPNSAFALEHFPLDGTKPPLAHQTQMDTITPLKEISNPTSHSSARVYPHVQMPYNHFNDTPDFSEQ